MSEFQLVQAPKINTKPSELDELAADLRAMSVGERDAYVEKMRKKQERKRAKSSAEGDEKG